MPEKFPTIASNRTKNRWLPCGCIVVMNVICILLPLMAYVAWTFRASGQVDAQIARIRQEGMPTQTEELDEFYRIEPGREDATAHYLEAQQVFSGDAFEAACLNLPIVGDLDLEIPPPGETWSEQRAVERFLDEYQGGLKALHQAAAIGGAARFPLNFDDGFSMLLPHAQEMRASARMLALEAHVKAHQGDTNGTVEAIVALATIGNSLENQPILVSQLVRVAMQGISINVTEELLPHVPFTDDELARLQAAFREQDFKAGFAHALAGERVIGAEAMRNPSEALDADSQSTLGRLVHASNEDLAFFLEIESDLRDAVQLDYPQTLDAVEATTDSLKARISTPFGRVRYIFTGLLVPAADVAVSAAARIDGTSRCLDAVLAVERFRLREHRLPDSLAELVPDFLDAVPIDPFDGQPIRYVVNDDHYLVYTCGNNRIDDGGVKDDQQTDSVIRIELRDGNKPIGSASSDETKPEASSLGTPSTRPDTPPSDDSPNDQPPSDQSPSDENENHEVQAKENPASDNPS